MIKVRYFYSACIGIETSDVSILCDPWFTEGAYDGSWYQYPKLDQPLEKIPEYDYIYVSHIHPDHYDAVFLRSYLSKHPRSKVIIADFKMNFLAKKMDGDGIPYEKIKEMSVGSTDFKIFPNEANVFDIDSALVVKRGSESVVNMNDNLFNESLISAVKSYAPDTTIVLMSYTGAGPYPQTYFDIGAELVSEAENKKKNFFDRYLKMAAALNAKVNIPFAGKYVLGGKLAGLNQYRGIADAVEILNIDKRAVVLQDGGQAAIDTNHLKASDVRVEPYDSVEFSKYMTKISDKPMAYETIFAGLQPDHVPFSRLLPKAYMNAHGKSQYDKDLYYCIQIPSANEGASWFVMNINKNKKDFFFRKEVSEIIPRNEVYADYRYLYGLLTLVFHWNNAEVGSQFFTRRYPNVFSRESQSFLNFFHV